MSASAFAEAVIAIRAELADQLLLDRGRAVDMLLEVWPLADADVRIGVERLIAAYQHVTLVEVGDMVGQLDRLVVLDAVEPDDLLLDPIG